MAATNSKDATVKNPKIVIGVGLLLCLVLILRQQLNEIAVCVCPFDK